ncbi:MAG: hypothetical protein QNJ72_15605 [Pleurocapsa sp. MO_226.B13]|nr:hypothetical protein [Pleurocapsa sp. MO_226.B13]
MNTSLNLLKISITEAIAFELEVNCGTSFSDGEFVKLWLSAIAEPNQYVT